MKKNTANKRIRRMMITMIAVFVLAILAVPASAATSNVTGIDIVKSSVSMKAGAQVGLQMGASFTGSTPDFSKTTWTSSNTSVATVKGGTVTAKKKGTVTITAKLGGKTDTCKVTVSATPARFVSAAGCYTDVNKYRNAVKAGTVKRDANLEKIAKIRAEEMAKSGKFSHTRPNGKSGLTLIKGNLYKGENIAMGQKTTSAVSKAWYNSAGHRKNMLKKQYKKVGIAGYEYNGVIYWAQVFSS